MAIIYMATLQYCISNWIELPYHSEGEGGKTFEVIVMQVSCSISIILHNYVKLLGQYYDIIGIIILEPNMTLKGASLREKGVGEIRAVT